MKDNNLEDIMPLTDLIINVDESESRMAFVSLIEGILAAGSSIDEWPDDVLDIRMQKQIVSALHQDLVSSVRKAVELLDLLKGELVE